MNANGCQIEGIVMPERTTTLNERLKHYLELIRDIADRPTYNALEAGFRHHPLTEREVTERLIEALDHIIVLASDALKEIPDAQR
jgi:predicted urease superfamily metal-dependent hydrolase